MVSHGIPWGSYGAAQYWIPDTTMNLPFHFTVSVNYHSDHGKLQVLTVAHLGEVFRAGKCSIL
jgi:hypothetical protein